MVDNDNKTKSFKSSEKLIDQENQLTKKVNLDD